MREEDSHHANNRHNYITFEVFMAMTMKNKTRPTQCYIPEDDILQAESYLYSWIADGKTKYSEQNGSKHSLD
jgi:hypothetical protein